MLGFGSQRKNMSNLLSMDTRIVYINMSLLGTSQGLSHQWDKAYKETKGSKKRIGWAVRIIDQKV